MRYLILVLALGLSACGEKTDPIQDFDTSCAEGLDLTYAGEVGEVLNYYCTNCHSSSASNRNGAPPDVNFDTQEAAQAKADRIVARSGSMPPGGSVDDQDRCVLAAWLEAGAP